MSLNSTTLPLFSLSLSLSFVTITNTTPAHVFHTVNAQTLLLSFGLAGCGDRAAPNFCCCQCSRTFKIAAGTCGLEAAQRTRQLRRVHCDGCCWLCRSCFFIFLLSIICRFLDCQINRTTNSPFLATFASFSSSACTRSLSVARPNQFWTKNFFHSNHRRLVYFMNLISKMCGFCVELSLTFLSAIKTHRKSDTLCRTTGRVCVLKFIATRS